jgi:hypothetical protein
MFNNDEVDSPLKTSAKVQIGVKVQVGGFKGKGPTRTMQFAF